MLSETEELLQPIPITNHGNYCQYPCYCQVGTERDKAYLDTLTRRLVNMVACGYDQYGRYSERRLLTPDQLVEEHGRVKVVFRLGSGEHG